MKNLVVNEKISIVSEKILVESENILIVSDKFLLRVKKIDRMVHFGSFSLTFTIFR